jgi:ABC-type glycerol-3-phosphate transport system substrate-binding protein
VDKKLIILGGVIFIFIIALVLFLVLGTKSKKPVAAVSGNPNKLIVWDSFDQDDDLSFIITNFKNRNPNADVEFVKKNPATFETDSVNAIAAGNGPDVWVIPSNWIPKQTLKLAPLPENSLDSTKKKTNAEIYKDAYWPVVYKDNVIDSKVYGFPLFTDSLSLYRNTEVLNKKYQDYMAKNPNADPEKVSKIFQTAPKTWDDLVTLVKYGGANTIALGAANVDWGSDILTALMIQQGAQMTSNDNSSALFHTANNLINTNSAYPGAKALSFYTSFAQNKNPNYTWDPKSDGSYKCFAKGELALMIGYMQTQKQLENESDIPFEISALPQITDTTQPVDLAYYQTMTVTKNSPRAALAWNFIRFATTDANSLDRYLNKKGLSTAVKSDATDYMSVQNKESVSWFNPDAAATDKIFKNTMDQVLAGQNPQTVVEGAAAEVTKLLGLLKS